MAMNAESQQLDDASAEQQFHPLELFWIAWRRKPLVFLGIAVGLTLGTLYYAQAKRIYSSEAEVLVVNKRPEAITEKGTATSQLQDYVSTHRVLMKSPLIVDRAAKEAKLASLETFLHTENLIEDLTNGLSVDRVIKDSSVASRDNVLRLTFSGANADDCCVIVNAVLESYKAFLAETYKDMSGETFGLISEAKDVLGKDLYNLEEEYRKHRENSPLISRGKDEISPLQERLVMVESQRSALLLRGAFCEGQLRTIESARKAGQTNKELVALVSELAEKLVNRTSSGDDPSGAQYSASYMKGQMLPLLVDERAAAENWGPKHPQVIAARQRVDDARSFFMLPAGAYARADRRGSQTNGAQSENVVDLYVQYLKQEMDRIKVSEQTLGELYDREREKAREIAAYEARDEDLKKRIARTETLYDGIVKRLQDAGMVKDYGGFDAKIIAPAGTGKLASPKALIVFPGSMFFGILCGVGLVYLAEITDKRFRSPDEIRWRLQLPVLSHIPAIRVDDALRDAAAAGGQMDPMLITYHRPRSPEAEAYRTVRTALYFSTLGEGHKVIQVTSPERGEGKSTLSANLAISIAQSGKRTLLLDADMRKPRVDKEFNVSAESGLSSVLAQGVDVADAVQQVGIDNLWVLPAGPRPPDPAELLTSRCFAELLDSLREQYDYVVVDTPPILPVTDACVVAPRADGVLMVIRISKHGRPCAERAKDVLENLGVRITGVVVNAAGNKGDDFGYGYGYGSYGYGAYGYGDYGYGGYGYSDDEEDEALDGNRGSGQSGNGNAFTKKANGKSSTRRLAEGVSD